LDFLHYICNMFICSHKPTELPTAHTGRYVQKEVSPQGQKAEVHAHNQYLKGLIYIRKVFL